MRTAVIATALLAAWLPAQAARADAEALAVEAIAPGVWVHRGRHATVDDAHREDSANLAFVAGERCVAVIDTGGSPRTGERLREAVRAHTGKPVCYVINTHVHFDHVLGNVAFTGGQARFVGHENLAEAIEANRDFFARNFAAELGEDGAARVVGPQDLVSGTLALDLGGRPLELTAHAVAHTSQDLTVLDVASGTLFLGDLVFVERMPALDGSVRGWIERLDALAAVPAQRAVPGHGPASVPWPAGADDVRRYLATLLAQTRAAIAGGRALEEAVAQVARGERERWIFFDEVNGRNVTRAYKELEWE